MVAPILVTGGTGTLDRAVVPKLAGGGHDVRVLTRLAPSHGPGVGRPRIGIQQAA